VTKNFRLAAFSILVTIPATLALAQPAMSRFDQCKFSYTRNVRDRVVAPALKSFVGSYFSDYGLSAPVVSAYRGKTHLLVFTFNPKHGSPSPSVGVVFDPCRQRAWVPLGAIE
jgi:hypothetical protein